MLPLGADPDNQAFKETWTTVYRLPEHGLLVKRRKEMGGHAFSQDVKAFAQLVTALRTRREDADYDPLAVFKISDVRNDIAQVDDLLTLFEAVDRAEQARFAWFVSLNRKGRGKETL